MSSTWIFDPRYGYYEVRFGGTAKVLQSYFAVAFSNLLFGCVYSKVFFNLPVASSPGSDAHDSELLLANTCATSLPGDGDTEYRDLF